MAAGSGRWAAGGSTQEWDPPPYLPVAQAPSHLLARILSHHRVSAAVQVSTNADDIAVGILGSGPGQYDLQNLAHDKAGVSLVRQGEALNADRGRAVLRDKPRGTGQHRMPAVGSWRIERKRGGSVS